MKPASSDPVPGSVLVTGAAGFLARRVVKRLAAHGSRVEAVTRPGGSRPVPHPGVHVHPIDVADPALAELVARLRPREVLHLAVARADRTPAERRTAMRTNVTATARLLDAAAAAGVGRFVHVGGALEYGAQEGAMAEDAPVRPHGYYGTTKAAASRLVSRRGEEGDLHTVVLRPFLVYGPGQAAERLIPTVLRAARDGSTVPLTDRAPARDWTYVDDVAGACLAALAARDLEPGAVINVGSGEQWTNLQVVEHARRVTGREIRVQEGAVPPRPWDRASWRAETTRLRGTLGVTPRGLDAGLAATWAAMGG